MYLIFYCLLFKCLIKIYYKLIRNRTANASILQNKNTGSPMSVVSRVFHKNVSKISMRKWMHAFYVSNLLSLIERKTVAASAAEGWGRVSGRRQRRPWGIQTQRGTHFILKISWILYGYVFQSTQCISRAALEKSRTGCSAKVSRWYSSAWQWQEYR